MTHKYPTDIARHIIHANKLLQLLYMHGLLSFGTEILSWISGWSLWVPFLYTIHCFSRFKARSSHGKG